MAQQFALDHPERCTRLVLACTYAFDVATIREFRAAVDPDHETGILIRDQVNDPLRALLPDS